MADDGKRVWVLGSGFSRSLGGPLLADLFQQDHIDDLQSFFPPGVYHQLAITTFAVQAYFNQGVREGRWLNAEQFLTFVDDAYRRGGDARRSVLAGLIRRGDEVMIGRQSVQLSTRAIVAETIVQNFDRVVRKALAAECSEFLVGQDPSTERWLPYREWVSSLQPDRDTVITFNYDRAIEMARDQVQRDIGQGLPIWIRHPDQGDRPNSVPVLKLHGSVDWQVVSSEGESRIVVSVRPEELLKGDSDIAIAAPGASKHEFVSKHFERLWEHAEQALAGARTVFFIGYSFPPTDPAPQDRLIRAFARDTELALRTDQAPHRHVYIVLGDTNCSRISRLVESGRGARQIAEPGRPTFKPMLYLHAEPLYAQDVIGRWDDFVR
jgi:hypothetical protein